MNKIVVREIRRSVGSQGKDRVPVTIVSGIVGRGTDLDATGRNYSFTLFASAEHLKVRLYDDDNRRNVRDDHLQHLRAAVIADYQNVKAGRIARTVMKEIFNLTAVDGVSFIPGYDKALQDREQHHAYAYVTAHSAELGRDVSAHESTAAFIQARRNAWEAAKNDARVPCGPVARAMIADELAEAESAKRFHERVANRAGDIGMFDRQGRFHGLAPQAGPIARIVASTISMGLSVGDGSSLADMESMYSQAISFALSHEPGMPGTRPHIFAMADRAIAAQHADEKVTTCQIYNLTGIDIYLGRSHPAIRSITFEPFAVADIPRMTAGQVSEWSDLADSIAAGGLLPVLPPSVRVQLRDCACNPSRLLAQVYKLATAARGNGSAEAMADALRDITDLCDLAD